MRSGLSAGLAIPREGARSGVSIAWLLRGWKWPQRIPPSDATRSMRGIVSVRRKMLGNALGGGVETRPGLHKMHPGRSRCPSYVTQWLKLLQSRRRATLSQPANGRAGDGPLHSSVATVSGCGWCTHSQPPCSSWRRRCGRDARNLRRSDGPSGAFATAPSAHSCGREGLEWRGRIGRGRICWEILCDELDEDSGARWARPLPSPSDSDSPAIGFGFRHPGFA
jgi:hypothetical protein